MGSSGVDQNVVDYDISDWLWTRRVEARPCISCEDIC